MSAHSVEKSSDHATSIVRVHMPCPGLLTELYVTFLSAVHTGQDDIYICTTSTSCCRIVCLGWAGLGAGALLRRCRGQVPATVRDAAVGRLDEARSRPSQKVNQTPGTP